MVGIKPTTFGIEPTTFVFSYSVNGLFSIQNLVNQSFCNQIVTVHWEVSSYQNSLDLHTIHGTWYIFADTTL
jgi:hypothetical protein